MTAKVEAFCSVFEEALRDIARKTPDGRCIILSGGVDTCAILAASRKQGILYRAAITVISETNCDDDFMCPDRGFAVSSAAEYDLEHHLISVNADDLINQYLPTCVKLLRTFDGMTLRNSLVIAAAFDKAAELGFKHVVVGDGADELFGGYSFMWGHAEDPAVWSEKRDKMCSAWTFATKTLALHYGVQSHSPYTAKITVDWTIASTERSDCIGVRPIRLVCNGALIDHECGKLILREAYHTVASWRRKDPIEVGSGITVISKDNFWTDIVPDEEYASERKRLLKIGYVIENKEHLINFRLFVKFFGEDGMGFPDNTRLELGKGCSGCCFEIGDKSFCHICGAFPAQRHNR